MRRRIALVVGTLLVLTLIPLAGSRVIAIPNPVATDELTYTAFGRVWSDPQGCLRPLSGVVPQGVSPWAKGNMCALQFLQYEEVIEGARFLARHMRGLGLPYLQVIRLDQAYENGDYMSAGIPRTIAMDDGQAELLSRDRRPLYLFKVTDPTSEIPESEKQHFAYSLSVHGIERAGLEGGVRAMEDLVTWAACEANPNAAPACAAEGVSPTSPKPIVETPVPEGTEVPTAGEVLDRAVVYFYDPNPDGWARGQVAPAEFEDGAINPSYAPGFFFQRYNGNGVDVNRDHPAVGYTFRPYSPGSEPETRAFTEVLRGIRDDTAAGRFAGGIDLHGMITAYAFSYTLLGAGQRDFRKNALSVDTSIRAWRDQTQRLAWSPYVSDPENDGENEAEAGCLGRGMNVPNVFEGGTRGRIPACVADQWGTVIDTIGYQVTGAIGDWMDSPIGLDAVGIDNEMYTSHLAPNTLFEPALEQTHIDGNKGLIYSQIAELLTAEEPTFSPGGTTGYVLNPNRLQVAAASRPANPGLPSQDDLEVMLPCQGTVQPQLEPLGCKGGSFSQAGNGGAFEFEIQGPSDGVWNGGVTSTYRGANVDGVGITNTAAMQLQHFDEGQWHTVAYHFRQGGGTTNMNAISADLYLPTGQVASVNDPQPGRWRVFFPFPTAFPGRLTIEFHRAEAEADPGQAAIDASSMDFFPELNRYVDDAQDLQAIQVADVLTNPASLDAFDTIVLVNNIGSPSYLRTRLGLTQKQVDTYFGNLKAWVNRGGNLVVTDAALQAVPRVQKNLAASAVRTDVPFANSSAIATTPSRAPAGSFYFDIGGGVITYEQPDVYPLARNVDRPGAAELERARRQAAEPSPLGYTPDPGLDQTPAMPVWGIDRAAWEAQCRTANCVTALSNPIDTDPGPGVVRQKHVSIGEMRFGEGTVRIAGVMFPDPVFEPDDRNDHRFGVSDYALTYTAYDVLANLIDPMP